MGGHQGLARTLSVVTRTFPWPGLRQELVDFISTCDSCQRAKALQKAPAGLLKSLPVPSQPWSSIGMDFIVKLPKSCGFNASLVIVDFYTKGAHLVPCNEDIDSPKLATIFIDQFIRHHGFPQKIVTDRGSLFVSTFWRLICAKLRIKPTPSTTYHPQTDGQTERMNQPLEEYLRHFCGYLQDDWANLLPMAEMCLNNTTAASTGFSPFFLWQGYHPCVNSLLTTSFVPAVNTYIDLLDQTQLEAAASLSWAKALQARYYNRGRRSGEVFQPGNRVLLSRCYISSLCPSGKLDFAYLGPFEVDSMVGCNAVKLRISHVYPKLHPVFNISLVSRYRDPSLNPQSRWWFSSFQLWWIGEEWRWSWTSISSRASPSIYCVGRGVVWPTILGSPCLSSQQHWILFFPLSMNCILGTLPSLPEVPNNMLWEVYWQPHRCPEVRAYCHKSNITNFSPKIQH
ncbi:hypothetical protein O181_071994 [Austropuccinia psidii MF-1]|uniref:Integrase catalytic domain-containing protein n=1 Tax=Austropuccinia psidii MF-1 TaxID=1389203 RepID=A0A9Q3F4B2_9BASI|nr:hypothetical protein [Austropuccinia psidii MF-1]